MKDNIEHFISEHRDEFDIHEPPPHLWHDINRKMLRKSNTRRIQINAVAASILLIIGFSAWFMFTAAPKQTFVNIREISPDPIIKDAEFYYTSMVKTQQSQLSQYCSDCPELCKDFKSEMDTLNILYSRLKTEYKNSNDNEIVLQAMIENLQAQVRLLTLQLQIIQNLKHRDNTGTPHLKTT